MHAFSILIVSYIIVDYCGDTVRRRILSLSREEFCLLEGGNRIQDTV